MSFEDFICGLAKGVKAEKVVKGGVLINVFTEELYQADVAICGNRILAVGDVKGFMNNDTKIIDATGYYLSPGLIDGHIHVECSKLSITMFAKLVLPRGTTAIVSGLDQIYVVAGLKGVRNFLAEAAKTPLKVLWGAPSKLPYTIPPSTVGFRFRLKEHRSTQLWPQCIGVWETVKEFVLENSREVIQAMRLARKNRLGVYGCAPMIDQFKLQLYAASGIRADHESYSAEETRSKIRSGLYGMVRESSVAHFLKENLKVVTKYKVNPKTICFCTDDVIASDVIRRGHLDNLVRMAIEEGVDPMKAIQMATINCAEAYRIDHEVGLIAPGRIADILMIPKLETFTVNKVIANGELVASGGRMIVDLLPPPRSPNLTKTIKSQKVKPEELVMKTRVRSGVATVLSIKVSEDIPFVRRKRIAKLKVKDGLILPDIVQDILYVAVLDRYHKKGRKALAFISGFKLRSGAIASSASPDDNNIICIGTNPRDMAIAINHIIENQGGQVVVDNGQVVDFLQLPIAGIVADIEPEKMAEYETRLDDRIKELGCALPSPMMYMIFLSITAIPDYAITDRGLIDCISFKIIKPIIKIERVGAG